MKELKNFIEEILIIIGLSIIVFATYLLSLVAALYVLGIILFLFGLFLAFAKSGKTENRGE